MENLIILYFVYLSIGASGAGRVSILDIARWMRTTKPTVKKRLDTLVELGHLSVDIQYSNGKAYRWLYGLTDKGQEYLDSVRDEAYGAYRIHVTKTIEAIKASGNPTEFTPVTKRQARAEKAGQKRLF
jgi:DNA-binding MarR family transcriptional regulator